MTAEGRCCQVTFDRDGKIGGHLLIREGNRTPVDRALLEGKDVGPVQPRGAR